MRKHLGWLACAALVALGCNDDELEDAGPNSIVVGGPCAGNVDCADGSYCQRGGDFPDGMCTLPCNVVDDCPFGSRCIDKEGGICQLECSSNADCRGGYECKDGDNRDGGKALVCKK